MPAPIRPSATSSRPLFAARPCQGRARRRGDRRDHRIAGASTPRRRKATAPASRFRFEEIEAKVEQNHAVANGYDADILIRWGDPVLPGAPAFDPLAQTADAQSKQFGYNNDFLGYFPMPGAANPSAHGLLVVNHEFTNEELMFPGIGRQDLRNVAFAKMTPELAAIEMAAHGGAVIEVRRDGGKWSVVPNSKYARRIDASTPMEITGPAAGHARLQTKDDPAGKRVLGMLNNCAGGVTPWGTWLTCEENFHGYFFGQLDEQHAEARNHKRYGVPGNWMAWGKYTDRFALAKEPNEPNRFGWIVEIDPFDPTSTPKKRTALGRAKHEGAAGIINKDGRYVVYTGDDERFDYVYRFVTTARVDTRQPEGQCRHSRQRHAVGRALRRRRHADLAAARLRRRPADRRERLQQPGRRADRNPPRRRPARRDEDGPARGRRSQSRDQQGLCRSDQQQPPQGGGGRCRQPARQQPVRPPDRDDPAGWRSRRGEVPLGDPGALRRSGGRRRRRDVLVRHHAQRLVRHAGQSRRRRRRPSVDCDRRQLRQGDRPRRWHLGHRDRRRRDAARRGTSIVRRSAPKCAVPASRPTAKRCSSPSSILARPTTTAGPLPRSKIPPPAGRTSRPDMPPRPSIVAITRRGGGKIGV